ncbi:hypothetical protein [Thermoflexus sp.]|uniref:hypothetical protein n=1 Tax=Thermoflexus sp. TaxID=1969742 RepID=UPI0035E4093A
MSALDKPPTAASGASSRWQTLREAIVLGATLASIWVLHRPALAPLRIVPPPTPAPTPTATPMQERLSRIFWRCCERTPIGWDSRGR